MSVKTSMASSPVAAAIYKWAEVWAAPHSETVAFCEYPLAAYATAITTWLAENKWCVPQDMKFTGLLLFRQVAATRFVPYTMDSHIFVITNTSIVILRVQTEADVAHVSLGYELFIAADARDLRAFAGSFRRHDGFFSDGLYGCTPVATAWVSRQYNDYMGDIDAHIRTLPGTYQSPLQDGWRILVDRDGRFLYEYEGRCTYNRPGREEPIVLTPSATSEPEEKEDHEPEPKANSKSKAKSVSKAIRKLPQQVRRLVWKTYVGREIGVTRCHCCKEKEIDHDDFECGHVIAKSEGGADDVANLRPICRECNRSMGTQHMEEYMEAYGYGALTVPLAHQTQKPRTRRNTAGAVQLNVSL